MKRPLKLISVIALLSLTFIISSTQANAENSGGTVIFPAITEIHLKPGEEKKITQNIQNNSDYEKQYSVETEVIIYDKLLRTDPFSDKLKITNSIQVSIEESIITVPSKEKEKVEIFVTPSENVIEDLYVLKTIFSPVKTDSQDISLKEEIISYTFITVAQDLTSVQSINITKFNFGKNMIWDFSLPWQNKNFSASGDITYENNGKSILSPNGYIAVKRDDFRLNNTQTLNADFQKLYPEDYLSENWEFTTSNYKCIKPFENYSIYSYVYPTPMNTNIYEFREQKVTVIYLFNILLYLIALIVITVTSLLLIKLVKKTKNPKFKTKEKITDPKTETSKKTTNSKIKTKKKATK